MRNKIFFLIGLCIFVYQRSFSQVVSQDNAQRVAEHFFESTNSANHRYPMQVHPWGSRDMPTMYVFYLSDQWVLVSGDRRVRPILAYSDANAGEFPAEEDMPPAMLYMLEWYSRQIDALRREATDVEYNTLWDSYLDANNRNINNRSVVVSPLLIRNGHENVWNQFGNNTMGASAEITKCYNKFCPPVNTSTQNCDHAFTGCVALATSQIIWYWQWPYAAIVEDDNSNSLLRIYDYSLMPYQLTNSSELAEADMVANLLHDVGVAVNMTYGCSESTAYPALIPSALQDVYGYHCSNLLYRSNYSNSQWINMMKGELDASRPISYGGHNDRGGHRFVVDGYNTDNTFHINYGRGGSHSGNYSIDSIYSGLNQLQSMVMNIRPNYPSCNSITIPSSNVWNTHFLIQNGGAINVGNRVVTNGMKGCILSGEYVNLTSGFQVKAGAEVYIAVKDMHCDDRGDESDFISPENVSYAPKKRDFENILPNIQKVIRDGKLCIIRDGKTFNIQGQEMREDTN